MPDQKKSDEIDVTDLIVKSIEALRINFWIIVFFIGIGMALGLAYYYTTSKVYQSKMIISSNILTESYCQTLFANFNSYINEGNAEVLAKQFHISESAAASISSLEVQAMTKAQSADGKESERFLITAEVLDRTILPDLQKGIIDYLQSNEFVKIRVEQNKKYFKQMIARVDKEIADMEEFKTRIYKGDFFENAKGNVMFDPTAVNTKILELTEKRINYENNLEIADSVQLIDAFTQLERQAKPKLSMSLVTGFLAGAGMALVFLLFRFVNKLSTAAQSAA